MFFLLCDGSSQLLRQVLFCVLRTSPLNLPVAHPGADDILRKGGLSVNRSNVPGSRNPVGMTIEQTIFHHVKSAGGIVGFSRNIPAYHRWCVTRHALLKWQVWTTLMTPFTKHLRPAQIQQNEEDVTKLCKAFEIFINPFDIECRDALYCLSSGAKAPPAIENELLYDRSQTLKLDEVK